MKYTFIRLNAAALLMLVASLASAQSSQVTERVHLPKQPAHTLKAVPAPQAITGLEEGGFGAPSVPPAQGMLYRSIVEEIAGATAYDLQTNGSEQSRVHVWPNGEISTVWCHSQEEETTTAASSYTDRGTAYNTRTQWLAGSTPTTRVENARTGFPNYVVTEDGTELIYAHRSAGGVFYILQSRRAPGGNWTFSDIPSTVPKGSLWCKAATDGNTVYVLSLTTPVASNGAIYEGLNGHVLMHRSKDAGLTWDKVDYIIPGLDQTKFAQLTSDSYAIDAKDDIVAVALCDSWNDAMLFKSEDGGDTWNDPLTILDFPLEKYISDTPYTVDDIGGEDPNGPSSTTDLEIFTSDGNVSLLIDNAGFTHIWVGRMYVVDTDFATAGRSFYPGMNGLMYWNELTPDDLFLVAGAPDLNNNDTLDITGTITNMGSNISSQATSAISINDTFYVAYSATIEGLVDGNNDALRHVLLIKSGDYGASWQDMYDVHYQTNDAVLADLQEGIRPYFAKRIGADGLLHMVYQRDYDAGLSILNNETPIQYIPGKTDLVYVSTQVSTSAKQPNQSISMQVTPNPASTQARISFDMLTGGEAQVELFNTFGIRVYSQAMQAQSGNNVLTVNTAAFASGAYFVRVNAKNLVGFSKFIVAN
jgi:hypothetical protein